MKLNYKQKIFLCFGIIFLFFSVGIAIFEQHRIKQYRTEALIEKLDAYANVVKYWTHGTGYGIRDTEENNFVRVTIIDKKGFVLYDNTIEDVATLENHSKRPEIEFANKNKTGYNIRTSTSNGQKYIYYAKSYNDKYIRTALPYNIETEQFLRADNGFLYFIIALFLFTLFFINYIAGMFGKSIKQLRDFTVAAETQQTTSLLHSQLFTLNFPKDELGEVGKRIVNIYQTLEENEKKIAQEHEKLLQHIHSTEEGVCFFSSERKVEFYNGLFIQYLNILVDSTTIEPSVIFSANFFETANIYLNENKNEKYFETTINKQGRYFSIHINLFDDKSFEIIIRDYTRQERTRLLKQEMTANIAHELRTPVTSVRGYIETILSQSLDAEKEHYFISKAYKQILNLSELISDISLITKIENAPEMFRMEKINIVSVIERVFEDFASVFEKNDILTEINIPQNTIICGNENLIYSIFRNLTENVINYAGKAVKISINLYNTDDTFYYFSFLDNGVGIKDEHHLNRIFERFYRINEGRTRDMGGSGLGLSIVKNAVTFHKGSISVKNRINGGLEFLFNLPID